MTHAIDHTALPFDEIIEQRMFPRDLPKEGGIVCRIMQDGWEIGTWIETGRIGAGPVARKILAVNDLLVALKDLTDRVDIVLYAGYVGHERIAKARTAIAKAEGRAA